MYSHPTTATFAAKYHQDELLREARNSRLIHEAHEAQHSDSHSTPHHGLVAAAVAVLMVVAAVALI
jgi:hypothetical protein